MKDTVLDSHRYRAIVVRSHYRRPSNPGLLSKVLFWPPIPKRLGRTLSFPGNDPADLLSVLRHSLSPDLAGTLGGSGTPGPLYTSSLQTSDFPCLVHAPLLPMVNCSPLGNRTRLCVTGYLVCRPWASQPSGRESGFSLTCLTSLCLTCTGLRDSFAQGSAHGP